MQRVAMRGWLLALTMLACADGAPAVAAVAVPSPGCGKSLASGTYEITDQTLTRTYRIAVPSRYRPGSPTPLVMVFHGWGGDENEFLDDAGVRALADERGDILVAPRGLGSGAPDAKRNSWSFRGSTTGLAGASDERGTGGAGTRGAATAICNAARTPNFTYPSCRRVARNTCSWTHCQADDVAFTLALVSQVESDLCVDRARVYAVGGSNGGMFTWELGQNPASATTFRALAALIGLPHRGYLDPPGKPGRLPMLLITGTQDTTVPPGAWESTRVTTTSDGGAYYYTGASAIMRRWGAANSCPYVGRPAAAFDAGTPRADCRTYCDDNPQGWSAGSARAGWPNVLDCRAPMGHDYPFEWAWRLFLDFFDAQS